MEHARRTIVRARRLPPGRMKKQLRRIGSVYHLLAKQGAYSNISFIEDFRIVKKIDDYLRQFTSFDG